MKKIMLSLGLLLSLGSFAQDASFSQLFNAPLLLNPALTGNFEQGKWRISGLYRNTSFGSMRSFNTGTIALDHRVNAKWLSANERLGVGVYGYVDESNGGALKSSYFAFSTAFNKAMNTAGTSHFGIGLQGVAASRRLDVGKLYYEDQFGSGGFVAPASSDITAKGGSDTYFDLNAGINFSHTGTKCGFEIGASIFHVGEPTDAFRSDGYHTPMRTCLSGKGYIKLKGSEDRLVAQLLYQTQGEMNYTQGGLYFSKNLSFASKGNTSLDIGALSRNTNVIIPYLGLGMGNTKGALTYDVTWNKSKMSGLNRQSLEVMLTYNF